MKAVVLAALVLVLALAIASSAEAQYRDRNTMSSGGCLTNGQVIFTFGKEGENSQDPTKLRVIAHRMSGINPVGQNMTLDGWFYYYEGFEEETSSDLFNWTPVDYTSSTVSVGNRLSMFASKEGYFKESGQYRIYVLNESRRRNVVATVDVACPGTVLACGLINVSVERCWNTEDGMFMAIFKATGTGYQSSSENARYVSIEKDFNYTFKGNRTSFTSTFPENGSMEELGGDLFYMEVKPGFEVLNLTIAASICKAERPFDYNSTSYKAQCEPVAECRKHSDCDDGDACTRDECIDYKCVRTDMCVVPEEPEDMPEPEQERPKDFFTVFIEGWMQAFGQIYRLLGMD